MRPAPLAALGLFCWIAATLPAASTQPTWSKEVSRLTQEKCALCHRPNDIGPFNLLTYEDAVTWADDIKRVVSERIMPPWKPVPGHGDFIDNFGLTDEERRTILDWIAAGTPAGDHNDLPPAPADTGEWQLGEPDRVVQMSEPYEVPRRKDDYRCFVLSPGLDADKMISAVQVVPGNRRVVHHVLLFLDTTGQAEKLDAAEEGPGYTCYGGPGFDIAAGGVAAALDLVSGLGGWVPGTRAHHLPEGVGLFLPKDAKIVMQVHYNSGGRPGPDQTKVGLYYSKKRVERRLRYLPLVNTRFRIPPGERDAEVTAELTVPFFLSAMAYQVAPHMHLIGRKIKVDMTLRDGNKDLIYIDDWDFNWQGFYSYRDPFAIPSGARLKLTCNYDNSRENPRNPSDPLKVVTWGEGTEDEMCLAFLGVTFDAERLNWVP